MLGKLPRFSYYRPSTLKEALAIMERCEGGGFGIVAGGTDLLVAMKEGKLNHPALVDIKSVPELGGIQPENGELRIGAAVCTRAIARSSLVRERFPIISQALKILGSMQVGNRATIGGNLCNASPAADSAPPLLTLNASVRLIGAQGERTLPLESFFLGPKKTVMDRELLVAVHVPFVTAQGSGVFYKLGPRGAPEDICIVSVAAFGIADASGKNWKEARIALGAVAPTPIRARIAEETLQGRPMEERIIADAARLAAEKDAQPITDLRASAEYRRAMVQVLVDRALRHIVRDTKGNSGE